MKSAALTNARTGRPVRVLFAETLAEREQGLRPFGPGLGMLLTAARNITMRDTPFPLVLVWLAPTGRAGEASVREIGLAPPNLWHLVPAPSGATAVVELPPSAVTLWPLRVGDILRMRIE